MKVYTINKKIGETPLEALRKFVKKQGLPLNGKYTYAGRLDPMAGGLLLILSNASQDQKEKYLNLPKIYEAEILFGLNTDSGDLLGIVKKGKKIKVKPADVSLAINKLIPFATLPLPAFSSVIVKGHPAFNFARAGEKIEMPVRKMVISFIIIKSLKTVAAKSVLARVTTRIQKVQGDFRQERILKVWGKLLNKSENRFQIVRLKIHCGSGTYIRSIADNLGKTLKTGALLYGLNRMAVGRYALKNTSKKQ